MVGRDDKITFITNEVWYSIKYHLKCIGKARDISMHFGGFETAKELLFVMTLILVVVCRGDWEIMEKIVF